MSGKRTKDDSEAVGIIKVFQSTERSSISSTTESVQINESTCSATSSSVDDHSSHTCSGTEQTTVIATPISQDCSSS